MILILATATSYTDLEVVFNLLGSLLRSSMKRVQLSMPVMAVSCLLLGGSAAEAMVLPVSIFCSTDWLYTVDDTWGVDAAGGGQQPFSPQSGAP